MAFFGKDCRAYLYRINSDLWENLELPEELGGIGQGTKCLFVSANEVFFSGGDLGAKAFILNLKNMRVTQRKPMTIPRSQHELVLHRERIFAISGFCSPEKNCTSECEVYDLGLDRWARIKEINFKRQKFGVYMLPNEFANQKHIRLWRGGPIEAHFRHRNLQHQ